ncbi:MAG TPA: threonine ammonia-lyase [Bdellovibrionales bacterium]|nr:threonine ammonia-lyase [Bdellovibrionales bacterium]
MRIVELSDIQKARSTIQNVIHRTSTLVSRTFSERLGTELFLKRENEQKTGSFKIRGAYNKIASLTAEEKRRGVIACSAGNHAQGVALSARLAGVKAHIVMPESAALVKIEATRDYGAEVILNGDYYDTAQDHARTLAAERGFVFIPPFEDPHIIAGQGTLGLELVEDAKDLDTVIVPIGGGGLISGVAVAVKALNPKCRVLGVQSVRAPGMAEAFKTKALGGAVKAASTIADGIAVKKPSPHIYENYISKYVDDIATVTEDEIAEAIVLLMERAKAVVEGAGATGLAALMAGKLKPGKRCAVVLSGGNIDMNIVEKVIERGLSRHGRLSRFSVVVDDVPGMLSRITACLAQQKANILQVEHDRISSDLALLETRIDLLVESNSEEHAKRIKAELKGLGLRLL